MRMRSVLIGAAVLALGETAHAAGFEKAVMWSGRYAGMGGAAAAISEGAQSLALNPAGLALLDRTEDGTLEVDLNFSPTFSRFRGPISSTIQLESEAGFQPIFAGFVSFRPIKRLGVGAGAYVSGGVAAKYDDVDFSGVNPLFGELRPQFESYLRVIEASVGAGFEIVDGLRIGAGWRIAFAGAELDTAAPVPAPVGAPAGTPPVALGSIHLSDLTDTAFNGFRIGAQYAQRSGRFSAGVHWRTPIDFAAAGNVSGRLQSGIPPATPAVDVPGGAATVRATFPSQLAAGIAVAPIPRVLRFVGEYVFTQYSDVPELAIDAALTTPTGTLAVPSLALAWEDQHNVRVGAEFMGLDFLTLRAGYVWTSQVTPEGRARATLAVPGSAHTVTGGVGSAIGRLRLDGAVEYSFGDGEGTNELGIPGTFEELAWVAHLGAGWVF